MARFVSFLMLSVGLLVGCGQARESAGSAPTSTGVAEIATDAAAPMGDGVLNEAESKESPPAPPVVPTPGQVPPPGVARKIIYHADLRVRVAAMARAAARLDSLARAAGGFVSGAHETRTDGEWRQQTTLRVPPGRFNGLLTALAGLGTVEEKTLTSADVTAQHADVTARLAAKRALEKEYLRLLTQGKKVSDLLEVQEKLGEVREDIEGTESRLRTLDDQVGYATISIELVQPLELRTPDAPVVSVSSRLVEALFDGWRLLVGLLIGVVSLWPFWLLGAAGAWGWRRWRRGRKVA